MHVRGVSGLGPEVDATEDDVLFAFQAPASLLDRASAVLGSRLAMVAAAAASAGLLCGVGGSAAFVAFGGFLIVRRVLR